MKNAFQPSLIGLMMITVLMFGVMTIAQKRGPRRTVGPCMDNCNTGKCKAECPKKKDGAVICMDHGTFCGCFFYPDIKGGKCRPY
ncbi:hypothetical protein N665_1029s0002 [Sinapis alba]|nr:hypothetical protein N665_1029s0002 [Sinapis alba]